MPLVIVAGTIGFASQDARDSAVAATAAIQSSTRTDEPGCLAYSFAADPVEPTVVQVYELWADERSLAGHFEHPNYAAMRAILREFPRAGQSATAKYRVDASEPVYAPDGTPRAAFG